MIIFSLLFSTFTFASDTPPRQVTVSGTCNHSVVSDRAAMTLTAQVRDPDIRTAAKKATEILERARESVKRLRLEDMELTTSEYSVQEIREWEKQKMISKGFQARMGMKVSSSNIQKMGEVIAIAAREGIQEVGGLSSYISNEKLLLEQTSCLEEAAKNAKTKADKLASALSASVGKPLSINENWSAPSGPINRPMLATPMFAAKAETDMTAPNVDAAKQDLAVTVQVSFELK